MVAGGDSAAYDAPEYRIRHDRRAARQEVLLDSAGDEELGPFSRRAFSTPAGSVTSRITLNTKVFAVFSVRIGLSEISAVNVLPSLHRAGRSGRPPINRTSGLAVYAARTPWVPRAETPRGHENLYRVASNRRGRYPNSFSVCALTKTIFALGNRQ